MKKVILNLAVTLDGFIEGPLWAAGSLCLKI